MQQLGELAREKLQINPSFSKVYQICDYVNTKF